MASEQPEPDVAPPISEVSASETGRSERFSTTRAVAIARSLELFNQWAEFVHLDHTVRTTALPKDLEDMIERSKKVPTWIYNSQAPEYAHAQPEFSEMIGTLSLSAKRHTTGVADDDLLNKHVRSSIVPILTVAQHDILLQESSYPKPSEADRRRAMDSLTAHVWEYQGDHQFVHRVECYLQLPVTPLPTESRADLIKPDASVFIMIDQNKLPGADRNILRACSSLPTRVQVASEWARVLHWVIEYKRDQGPGVSQRQVLQGMVTALYQRRALGFRSHFVFGMAHHSVNSLDVFAARWDPPENNEDGASPPVESKIVVYKLGAYAMESAREILELYLLMRETRALARTYKEELGQITFARADAIYQNMSTDKNCTWPPPYPPTAAGSTSKSGTGRKRLRGMPGIPEQRQCGEAVPVKVVGVDVPLESRYVKELLQSNPVTKVHAYLASGGPGDYEQVEEQVIADYSD